MDLKIQYKVALVLAASKGLGRAIATTLANEGASVVIGSRDKQELEKTAAEIIASTRQVNVIAVPVDVTQPDQLQNIVIETIKAFGTIDILVNNAGGPPFNKFESFDDEQWLATFNQNLLSVVRTSRLVVPYMRQAGGGRIINIISASVKSVMDNSVLSTSMRMGVVGMAKLLADEVAPYGITVNNVAPGLILTDRIKETLPAGNPEEALKQKTKNIPAGRIGKPEELAAVVAFLASEQAAYITGTTIPVDGGSNRGIY
ncbi:SDR family oxidoreductase [Mucilaginibacter paludis]|uniref:Short-chain dehydrogenase/reductase SDR n=1 Tax=Mucilaginibacter paludis DSM 18603 TaxID=714943 RepID=H1Y2C9_9SPHI|nr:SDR family oxidoreductase [Mucilaginibacter paludis]EHQ27909.1 short-chain dehydrogenase/reductase SDR [Mucilaginibacter paludis DSM 18603]